MATKRNKKRNLIAIFLIICILIAKCSFAAEESTPETQVVEPTKNQYMMLKATEVNTIEGKDKQVIFELWSYDIEFQGFDVRFSYDGTKFAPSNMITNEYTENGDEFFVFESEFANYMELFAVEYTGEAPYGTRAILSFNPPAVETEHIKNKNGEMTVVSTGGILIGKMSFRMKADTFDISSFKLETGDTAPQTGIRIDIDGEAGGWHYFKNQSVFIFDDKTASKNANLADLTLSTGEKNDENPEEATYKEYTLNPEFKTEIFEYTLEILEYIDKMDLTITKEDEKSTIKLKTPKRDENGKLCYEENGTTIIYEEKEISDLKQEITLNKLGEADTIVEVKVTAEDKTTTNTYKITIHRPYGTIKGSIYTAPTADKEIYKSNIKIYKSNETALSINWEDFKTVTNGDTLHEELLKLKSQNYETKDNGTYEVYVIPGKYDILLDKDGYLDHIYININVDTDITVDLGQKELFAGDINKDGVVQLRDLTTLKSHYGIIASDGAEFDENEMIDFNKDGEIQLRDLTALKSHYGECRIIEEKGEGS